MTAHRIGIALLILSAFPAQAEYAVGHLYLNTGRPEKAYREFRELAEVGFSFYMNMIANMHWHGIGVPRDPLLAHVWYSLSAAQQDVEGIAGRQRVGRTLTPQQLRQSKELTRRYAELYLRPLVADWKLPE